MGGSKEAAMAGGLIEPLKGTQKHEQNQAHLEFKRRRLALKQEKREKEKEKESATASGAAAGASSPSPDGDITASSTAAASSSAASRTDAKRELVKSRYLEDVHPNGHRSVWGSWYSVDEKKWGFVCCKEMERKGNCSLVD